MTEQQEYRLRAWIKAALIRAARTWAQAALGYLGAGAAGVLETDWVAFFSVTTMAAVISVLTSIAGLPEVEDGADLPALVSIKGKHGGE